MCGHGLALMTKKQQDLALGYTKLQVKELNNDDLYKKIRATRNRL